MHHAVGFLTVLVATLIALLVSPLISGFTGSKGVI